MAPLKERVDGWRLVKSEPGSYRYERRIGNQVFELFITEYEPGGFWEMGASGGSDAERFGGATNMEDSFDEARRKAYRFMRSFQHGGHHSRGYNSVVEAADQSGWERY